MPDQLTLDPQHTALLVMDYQSGIIDQLPDNEKLLNRVSAAIDTVRTHGGHVGWVRVAFEHEEFDAIPETSMFAPMASAERRSYLHTDAPTTQIHAELDLRPGDIKVRKVRVGAFTTTDLDQQLRASGITTLVLAGLSTSGVVLSTVREAMDRDYRVIVLADACGDRDLDTHSFLIDKLFPAQSQVITVNELNALWI
jgi:nicotinamidase-related amidase